LAIPEFLLNEEVTKMSEAGDEVKLAIIIGITIVLVWKAIDLFSKIFIKFLTDTWKNAPEFAIEIIGFTAIAIVFAMAVLIYIVRSR
jgi:hypothetical protein